MGAASPAQERLLMGLRALLIGLIVVATIGFVVGTAIERHNSHHESAAQLKSEGKAPASAEGGGESAAQHAAETGTSSSESGGESSPTKAAEGASSTGAGEAHKELRPLGIDIEAVPFVILAALASLALAVAAWVRPRSVAVLLILAAAMLVFGVLDIREIFHQDDEGQTGLAVLAGVVAAVHFAAAAVAVVLVRRDQRTARPAGTMPA
jgi:hypothetical protein